MNDNRQTEHLEDAEIIHRVAGGDVNAFELLVLRYGALVRGIVARHVPVDAIEEVAQDVFISAYRALASYSGQSGFKQWLARIAVRRCCDFWRERQRIRETPFSQLTDDHQRWLDGVLAADSSASFHGGVARAEVKEILDLALARLSAENRTVLTLVYLDGMPVKEAADLLGWNSVLLRVRAHRAKAQLRKVISDLLGMRGQDEKNA